MAKLKGRSSESLPVATTLGSVHDPKKFGTGDWEPESSCGLLSQMLTTASAGIMVRDRDSRDEAQLLCDRLRKRR
jgi:hypothetical protein